MEQAAFEIDGIENGDRTAWSVIVSGVTEEITSRDEIERLAAIAHESWAPGDRHYWARIRAYTVSGRRIARAQASSEPQT
jgi:nitroimidazol reductase NimA-like FMN-containing flavoprotein (pyridoxamine 5'-phosphate oxidase superfamily)